MRKIEAERRAVERDLGDLPTCGILTSKPSQIQAVSHPGDYNCGPHTALYALCEDGTIWVQYHASPNSNVPADGLWHMLQPPAGWRYSDEQPIR